MLRTPTGYRAGGDCTMWMIQATIVSCDKMSFFRELPTFFLSEDILGILNEESARNHAESFLEDAAPGCCFEYSISVRKL